MCFPFVCGGKASHSLHTTELRTKYYDNEPEERGTRRGSEVPPYPWCRRRAPASLLASAGSERETPRRSELRDGSAARAVVGWRSTSTALPLGRRSSQATTWLPLYFFRGGESPPLSLHAGCVYPRTAMVMRDSVPATLIGPRVILLLTCWQFTLLRRGERLVCENQQVRRCDTSSQPGRLRTWTLLRGKKNFLICSMNWSFPWTQTWPEPKHCWHGHAGSCWAPAGLL